MKSNVKQQILIYFFLLFFCKSVSAQISIFGVNCENFPIIKNSFIAFDSNFKVLNNFALQDISIKEDGITRKILNIKCQPSKPPLPISSVLVVDISGSMKCQSRRNLELAKEGAKAFIQGLPDGTPWECAITAFDDRNFLVKDFTNNKSKLISGIEELKIGGNCNYDAGFIEPSAGGLNIAKKGKYKRIIVFMAYDLPSYEPQTWRIIQEAKENNIAIYCITIKMPAPMYLKTISEQTGGRWFEKISTVEHVKAVYLAIMQMATEQTEPCEIEWQSDTSCFRLRNVEIVYLPANIKASFEYIAPEESVSKLELVPSQIYFGEILPLRTKDTTITLYAREGSINILQLKIKNPRFSIIDFGGSPPPFSLKKGESRKIVLRYFAPDSGLVTTFLEVVSDACLSTGAYLAAGFKDKIPDNSLKLVYPNGGEEFLVGSSMVLIWEGVLPSDTVILEYSTDAGVSWNLITDKATGLRYEWKNIPNTPSRRCLARVRKDQSCTFSVQKISPLPFKLYGAEGIYVPVENKVFVFGGLVSTTSDVLSDKILIYDIDRDTWVISRANLPYGILGQGFTTDNISKIYISPQIGPKVNNGWGSHRKLIEYDFKKEIAREIGPDLNNTDIWGCDLVYRNGYIYIFGGWNGSALDMISKYSVQNNTLTRLKAKLPKPSHFDNVLVKDSLVYLVGGWTARAIQVFNINTEQIEYKSTFQTSDILDGWDFTIFNFCKDTSIMITPKTYQCFKFSLQTYSIWETKIPEEIYFLKSQYNFLPQEVELPDGRIILFGGIKKDGNVTNECYLLKPSSSNDLTFSDASDSLWSIVMPQISLDSVYIGTVCIDTQRDTVLLAFVKNSLKIPLKIDSLRITGLNFYDFYLISDINSSAIEVYPGDEFAIKIGFKPSAPGYREAELNIYLGNVVIKCKLFGYGETKAIDVLTKSILFPEVKKGKMKDTTVTFVIVNRSNRKITIKNTRLVGFGTGSFQILSGGGSFELAPGEGRDIVVRFKPQETGRIQCYLEFETDDDCQSSLIDLFGVGEKCTPEILAQTGQIDTLICSDLKIDTLKISNVGCDTLKISDVTINSTHPEFFHFTIPYQSYVIPPNTDIFIPYEINLPKPGKYTATFIVHSNSDPDSTITISTTVIKELVNYVTSVDTVDLGFLCINEGKDTTIIINNVGTLPLVVLIQVDSILKVNADKILLDTNQTRELLIHLNGLSKEGEICGKIVFIDTICKNIKEVFVKGKVELPLISVSDLEIVSVLGNYNEDTIFVLNKGNRDVTIHSLYGLKEPFELIEIQFPLVLKSGETIGLKLRYIPDDDLQDTINILINYEPCNGFEKIVVIGVPVKATAIITTLELEGAPGERITFPIILKEARYLKEAGIHSVNVSLLFNHTLLFPIGLDFERIDESKSIIKLERLPVADKIGQKISEVEFLVGLGNSFGCPISFKDGQTFDGRGDVIFVDGYFRLKGICYEGGARLVNPSGKFGIVNVIPNPTNDEVEVELLLGEKGQAELILYNLFGEVYKKVQLNGELVTGNVKLKLTTRELPSGVYLLQLQTPTIIDNQKLLIYHK